MLQSHAEIAHQVRTGGFTTNVHDTGSGDPVLLIHGSGLGVSAWANWRLVMPELARRARVLAPDMAGFGYSERPPGLRYGMDAWVRQAVDLLDALANSLTLSSWIARSQLHVYGQCGHWTQIEHAARFARLVGDFLAEARPGEPLPLTSPQP